MVGVSFPLLHLEHLVPIPRITLFPRANELCELFVGLERCCSMRQNGRTAKKRFPMGSQKDGRGVICCQGHVTKSMTPTTMLAATSPQMILDCQRGCILVIPNQTALKVSGLLQGKLLSVFLIHH